MRRFYAGIGSRETPDHICREMTLLAARLEKLGWWLRSGNARGADQAFACGVETNAQIWLPWSNFEHSFQRTRPQHKYRLLVHDDEAIASIDEFHPRPESLSSAGQAFMARNYRQVIGRDEPNSEFIFCWTKEGKPAGGTAQAIRIADKHKIPIINMFHFPTARQVLDHLKIWYGF